MESAMLRLNAILGQATDPEFFDKLHHLQHNGRVERIVLGAEDAARHRLRVQTDAGSECAISLPRDQRLNNGSILLFEQDRAIVVMMREEEVLKLAPADAAAALELGYFAGNMHWPVRFHAGELHILMHGPAHSYLDRLDPMLASRRVAVVQS
jgi:urease accessory protein